MTARKPLKFTALDGFFAFDERATRPKPADASAMPQLTTLPGLGLIDQPYPTDSDFDPEGKKQPWERFTHYLHHLNETEKGKAWHKLIYVTRHGQGYHNAKESAVGTAEWESKWVHLNGDDKTTWFDSNLTPLGRSQALSLQEFWQTNSSTLKLPLPQKVYSSPLTRCLETTQLSCSFLFPPKEQDTPPAPSPIVKELLRERLHRHTCDRRRPRSYISDSFPLFKLEEGFTEEDELWKPEGRETLEEHTERVKTVLNQVFAANGDEEEIISFTAHYGTIEALIAATGHRWFWVSPANVVPFLIKAEEV
ncbi:histidine phosphatase superfamily [Podospora australis]|uniref:Histidine phosphatase superfamily n=1 Tax=Podospora australis TaxID=1536484 RepID=A0AAN7AF70_9PEZI|nr:histidine phosphatase superfamily [Podospora australis]